MYVSIRHYKMGAGSIDALARRLDVEFAPALGQEPGFRGYLAVDTGDGTIETISVFADEASARRSDELAAEYVADDLADFRLERTERRGGEVLVGRATPAMTVPWRRWRGERARARSAARRAPVAVIGATGRTGRLIVERLLARDVPVHALVRDTARARQVLPAGVRQFAGDVRRPETLAAPLAGAEAVIVATSGGAGQDDSAVVVDYFGTAHLVKEAAVAGVGVVVYVSSIYASRPDYYQDVEPTSLGWKARAEERVRESGLDYSIVRAGWLTDGPAGEPLALTQGDTGEGRLSRADLAEVCAQVLAMPEARGKTFEVVAARGAERRPLGDAVAELKPDGEALTTA
jgi:uncharacterized protein YbjT (DUF2867 family)